MQAIGLKALRSFLVGQLESNYALHEEHFESYLAEILRNNLPKDQAHSADTLAAECAPNDPDADDRLDKLLCSISLNISTVLDDAPAAKAEELVQAYARAESDSVKLVDKLLAEAGTSMDAFLADALVEETEQLDYIERIDRLASIAESRRNTSLREIDRRRAVLGEKLRRSVQQIEHNESEVIKPTPAKGKDAA